MPEIKHSEGCKKVVDREKDECFHTWNDFDEKGRLICSNPSCKMLHTKFLSNSVSSPAPTKKECPYCRGSGTSSKNIMNCVYCEGTGIGDEK